MTRLNSRQRKKDYAFLVDRDGEKCKICGVKASSKIKLVVEHIDNDDNNDNPDNKQLACYSCNYKKNPRKKQPLDPVSVSEGEKESMEKKYSSEPNTEIEINRIKEPQFREYARKRVSEEGLVTISDLVDAGAEKIGLSQATTTRYLKKMYSSAGEFVRIRDRNRMVIRTK